MSFTQRLLTFQITLANGNFQGGGNSLTLSNVRASCKIDVNGGLSSSAVSCEIFGLTLAQMNQLTSLPQFKSYNKNSLLIQAGNGDGNGNPTGTMTTVFSGNITNAWMDGQGQPQVPFRMMGTPDGLQRVMPAPSTSVQGTGDVATMMQSLATAMGLTFENNGVSVKLSNPYFHGSPRLQAAELARAAGIEHIVDKGKLAIWNPGQGRKGSVVTISPQNGLIGYPTFYSQNVILKNEFNPAIEFGQQVKVQSDLTAACGTWTINKLSHDLASLMPHGPWFSVIQAYGPGTPPP